MKMILKSILLSLLAINLTAASSHAAKKTATKIASTPLVGTVYDPQLLTDAQIKTHLKEAFDAENKNRSPADSVDANIGNTSADFKKYRDQDLAMKSAADVKKFLDDLNTAYPTFHDNDIKFFAARILPMRTMGGFFWRIVPLVSQSRMSEEMAASGLRGIYEQMEIRFPEAQNTAIFDFLIQPQTTPQTAAQIQANAPQVLPPTFKKVSDLQAFVNNVFYNAVTASIVKLEGINLNGVPIAMDTELRFGDEGINASVSHKHFKWIGNAELAMTLARLHKRASNLLVFTAYQMDDFTAYRKNIAQRIGFDVATTTALFPITGLDRKTRVSVLKSYTNLMHLNDTMVTVNGQQVKYGVNQMQVAYDNLASAVTYIENAWAAIQKEQTGQEHYNTALSILDPELSAGRKADINEAIENLRGLVPLPTNTARSAYTLHDAVSGSKVMVDLKSFYMNPPEDMKSLLPTEFSPGVGRSDGSGWVSTTVAGVTTKSRDYGKGRATGWDRNAYATVFPSLGTGEDVDDYQRVILRTCGGRFISGGLFGFIK